MKITVFRRESLNIVVSFHVLTGNTHVSGFDLFCPEVMLSDNNFKLHTRSYAGTCERKLNII